MQVGEVINTGGGGQKKVIKNGEIIMSVLVSPEIGRLAMQQGLELPFVVWSILRASVVAENGSSHFTKKKAALLAAKNGLKFSQRHWQRIWQQGTYYFWGMERNRIYMRSFAKVTERLGELAKHEEITRQRDVFFVEIQLSKGLESLRSELYWAWFAQFSERTISRATLQDLFNISPFQQRSFEAELGQKLSVKTNYAHIDNEMYKDNPQDLPEHHFTVTFEREISLNQDPGANAGFEMQEVVAHQYQLPNTFRALHGDSSNVIPVPFAPNRARNAVKSLSRQTDSLHPTKRIYWLSRRKFERLASETDLLRVAWQGKKSLWIIGHFS